MKSDKVRVLHVENAMGYTGGFKALLDYIRTEKNKVDSVVVLKKGSRCKVLLEEEGVKVYEIPFVEVSRSIVNLLIYLPCLLINAWTINNIARKEKIDILHANDLYNLSLHVVKYVYRFHRPLVVHIRLMPSSYPNFIYKYWLRIHLNYAQAIIAVSYAVKRACGSSDKIQVVYDVIESLEKHPEYHFTYTTDASVPFRFLYLANFTRGKGQELALEAFSHLMPDHPNLSLTFAGSTFGKVGNMQFKEELQQATDRLQLSTKVVFEDFVTDVELKMKQYDCILNFSLAESFSFTSYDALRFGIPLVVSDCGGPSELFEHGKSGLLVKNGDVSEMSKVMDLISKDPELARNLSLNSKSHITNLVSNNNKFDYLSELFISLNKTTLEYGTHKH